MAWAISRILGVPWSALSTPRVSEKPTSTAAIAVPTENSSQNHSLLPNVNAWYPPSAAQFISTAPPVVRSPLSHPAAGGLPRARTPPLILPCGLRRSPPAASTRAWLPYHGSCGEDGGPASPRRVRGRPTPRPGALPP